MKMEIQHQNLYNSVKIRGKFIALNVYTRKKENTKNQ